MHPVHLSIIIPLAPEETAGELLLTQLMVQKHALKQLGNSATIDIVLVGDIGKKLCEQCALVLPTAASRPEALNAGAKAACGDFLWFLHADTHLPNNALERVLRVLEGTPPEPILYYCDLRFLPDATPLMAFNSFGVWLRSRLFKTPFGDQAFLVTKHVFDSLGHYPTHLPYGEDHALVIAARKAGVPIRHVGLTVRTSARKYRQQGWAKTTYQHLRYTVQQYWRSVRTHH